MGTTLVIGKPLPFVRAFVDTVDAAIAAYSPRQRMSALHRTGLAFCVTAILVTNAICWARFERASLGAYALAALSGMFRHAKIPGEHLWVARVRVIVASYGITGGSLVIADTDKQRSNVATTLAYVDTRRDPESGGQIGGQSLVLLVLVTQTITIPLGLACYPPAPELSAWSTQDKRRKPQGIPPQQRPPKPPPKPPSPTKQALALRLRRQCQAHHPTLRVSCLVADALYGAATFVEAAAAIFGGVQVIRQRRSNQQVRLYKHAQYVADYCASHPGTLQHIRLRGGEEISVLVGSARVQVCAHHTKRLIIALPYAGEDSYRYLLASDLTWRTLDLVQGDPLRWLVEVFVPDWKSPAGGNQLTKQPGHEEACRSVILSLLGDHCLFLHPDQHAHRRTNLPAYPVGRLRANVQVECLVDVIQHRIASEDPQSQLQRFTQALREVFAFSRSTTPLIQRQLGRLEPTPYLQYRADEVMRNVQLLST